MPSGYYERFPVKEWTQEELEFIWNNKDKKPKYFSDYISDRSVKSIKHILYSFQKITEEIEDFLLENRLTIVAANIDKKFELPQGTAHKYFLMKNLEYLHRPNGYRKEEIELIEKLAGFKTYQEIADILNVSESRVRNLASKKGYKKKIRWTDDLKSKVFNMLENKNSLESISKEINKPVNSIKVMLRKEGYEDYIELKKSSKYHISLPEKIIMDRISKEFNIVFPKKNRENNDYYYGIIPPYEIDIPFELNGYKFAIEHDGEWWHRDKKDLDLEKEKLIKEKGYFFFRISSNQYKYNDLSTLDSILDILVQAIKNIINQ